jgi:hypothetical protein
MIISYQYIIINIYIHNLISNRTSFCIDIHRYYFQVMTGGGIASGFCYDIHVYSMFEFTCFGTLVNIINSVVCFFMFGYSLRKMQSNHRRALAGYTKNTINIDVHMNLMMAVAIWCLIWGIYMLFDLADDMAESAMDQYRYKRLFGWTRGVIYGLTSFLECAVLLLLCSPSIGVNAFRTYWASSSTWGLVTLFTIGLVTVNSSGESNYIFGYVNYVMVIVVRSAMTIGINIIILWYFGIRSSTERPAVIRYSNYLIILYSSTLIANLCVVSRREATANFGLCLGDLTEIVHLGTFASVIYLALKRDCQYWSSGEEQEEKLMIDNENESLTWSQLPNYKDVVIPKTELFFRSKLQERLDISVETHLWRRQIVVVKRFRFDFLTKDNIKYFKKEANIFKILNHENIVKFYGVLIDPPTLGIVMQFGANGDLFENLDKLRQNHIANCKSTGTATSAAASAKRGSQKRSSIGLDESFVNQMSPSGGNGNDSSIDTGASSSTGYGQRNPLNDSTESRDDSVDDIGGQSMVSRYGERERERSTLNWSVDPRRFTLGSKIAQTISSVASGTRSNITSTSEFEPLVCMHQVVQGMAYLHSQNVTHSDLKVLIILHCSIICNIALMIVLIVY